MNCIPIGPPNFVDFPERSQTSYKKEYGNTLPVKVLWNDKYVYRSGKKNYRFLVFLSLSRSFDFLFFSQVLFAPYILSSLP